MTILSPEHRGSERGRDSEIRERRIEPKKWRKGNERVRGGEERNKHKRKVEKGKCRKGNERRGKGEERRRKERGREDLHEQPSRKCEAPLPCQPASATLHNTHTHTLSFAPTTVVFSLSLRVSHTSHFTHTNISSLLLQDHTD